jgi:hypothetical protein
MKLEPVYLLAPKPAPKSMPTRRAWLLAGCAFAAGVVGGSACQSWFGVGKPETPPQIDPMRDWLQKVCADSTPIEQLLQYRLSLYMQLPKWSDDALLWRGIDRLVAIVMSKADLADRKRVALELLLFLENADLPDDAAGRWDLESLRRIARGG